MVLVRSSNANTSTSYEHASISLVDDANKAVTNNDFDKALIFFHQAMVANPQNITAYVGLGDLYSTKGRYQMGLKYYNIALSIDPIDIFALEGQVLTHLKRQDLKSAEESFSTMQQVCEIAVCEQFLGVAEAIEAYQEEAENN